MNNRLALILTLSLAACGTTTYQTIIDDAPKVLDAAGLACDVLIQFEDTGATRAVCLTVEALSEYLAKPRTMAIAQCAAEFRYRDDYGEHYACLTINDLRTLANAQDRGEK